MNIQSINANNYQNNTTFKSKIVPTEFLRRTLDHAIEKPSCQRSFYDSLLKILNDGKNDVVKFDYANGKLLQKILPGAYNTTVNEVKKPWNAYFGSLCVESQCRYAIEDYAEDINYIPPESRLDKVKKRYNQAWKQLVKLDCSEMSAKKVEKYMMKKVEYLKGLYNKTLSEELQRVKKEIFQSK